MTGSLAKALFGIVILSVLATGLALTTVAGSQSDAEAINIAGSLRMQSYRLAFDLDQQSPELELHLQQYRQSLQAPALQKLARFYVPAEVRNHYLALQRAWQTMERQIRGGQAAAYRAEVAGYVNRVDHFVSALQRYSELKLTVAAVSVIGYAAIIGLVLFCIRFMRRRWSRRCSIWSTPASACSSATSATRSWTWRCRTSSACCRKPSAPCRTSWPGSISRWS